jgi:N-acylglucosamine-6-phosphate 2-epimerase
MHPVIERLRGGLIVSVQIHHPDSPLNDAGTMARLARAAVDGGAIAIRAGGIGGLPHLRAVRAAVDVPLIGLVKLDGSDVYITPTLASARAVAETGADIVALDGTGRPRPDGALLHESITAVHELEKLVLADVSNAAEGLAAAQAGADLVSSTLAGYTGTPPAIDGPDLHLVAALVETLAGLGNVPVVAEGRYHRPDQARSALDFGAHAVVVGTAITEPAWITGTFRAAMGLLA